MTKTMTLRRRKDGRKDGMEEGREEGREEGGFDFAPRPWQQYYAPVVQQYDSRRCKSGGRSTQRKNALHARKHRHKAHTLATLFPANGTRCVSTSWMRTPKLSRSVSVGDTPRVGGGEAGREGGRDGGVDGEGGREAGRRNDKRYKQSQH